MHRVGDGLVYISHEELEELLREKKTPWWIPVVYFLGGSTIPWIILWATGAL